MSFSFQKKKVQEKDTIFHLNKNKETLLYDTLIHNSSGSATDNHVLVEGHEGDSLAVNKNIHEIRHEGEQKVFSLEQTDSVFGLLLLCFLLFAHIYNGGITFLKENMMLLFSPKKMQRVHRQTTTSELLYSYFLIFQAVVLVSISIYDVFLENNSFLEVEAKNPIHVILSFIILIALFLGGKVLIYKIIGFIFDRPKELFVLKRAYLISFETLGLLYFIPTLLLLYTASLNFQVVIFMVVLFLIVHAALFFQIIIFFINEKFNFLYLIAYLCTFEILPYIFLYLGLVYLYKIDIFNILWL